MQNNFKEAGMDALQIFRFLRDDMHTVVMATADGEGNLVTCAVDIMDADEGGLYFLTARGKSLYSRLKARPQLSLTGIKGSSTLTSVAITVSGLCREAGEEELRTLLDKNRYMYEIYPTEASRAALAAFKIYRGRGEVFDLSKLPIERTNFTFGGDASAEPAYFITESCTACGKCAEVCPQGCISFEGGRASIAQRHCLRCGNCMAACPCGAVVLKSI